MFCDAYRDILVTVLRLFRKDVALKLSSSACSLSLVSAELLSEEAPHAASLGGATFISLPSKRVLPREAKFESTAGVCLLIPSCDFVSPLSRSRRPSGASEPYITIKSRGYEQIVIPPPPNPYYRNELKNVRDSIIYDQKRSR